MHYVTWPSPVPVNMGNAFCVHVKMKITAITLLILTTVNGPSFQHHKFQIVIIVISISLIHLYPPLNWLFQGSHPPETKVIYTIFTSLFFLHFKLTTAMYAIHVILKVDWELFTAYYILLINCNQQWHLCTTAKHIHIWVY